MSIKVMISLSILVLSLGACASKSMTSKPAEKEPNVTKTLDIKKTETPTSRQDRINSLLLFIDRYSNDTLDAQRKSFNETNRTLIENKLDLTERIKLAIMLSLPSSRMRDTTKAQSLLQDLLQENSLNPTESAFAGLFYEYVLDDIKQSQKNRDDLKKLDLNQQKLEALQQKYDALDKKLNDLKNIEKTISDRDSKVISKPVTKP
jgi:glutathionylspermidine synthase